MSVSTSQASMVVLWNRKTSDKQKGKNMSSFEKKEYDLVGNTTAISYEVTDDYGHTAQLTREEAKRLARWLTALLYPSAQKVAPLPEEEEAEQEKPRSTQKWHIMQQACHERVMSRKRLTLKQGAWLYNHYINCYTHARATLPAHNRMVDELRIAHMRLRELEQEGK